MRATRAYRLLSLLVLLQSVLWAQEDIEALAKRSPRDATKRVLAGSTDDQAKAVASLLRHVEPNCRQTALGVLEATWNVKAIPMLRDIVGGERVPLVRDRAAKLLQTLTLYEPIAVEAATPEPDEVADPMASRWFRPVPMVVMVRDMNGQPVPGALVQAYAPEYGICVPFGKHEKADAQGACRLDLFPATWRFTAAASSAGAGLYVSEEHRDIVQGHELVLRPKKRVAVSFRRGTGALDVDDVWAVDSRAARWFAPVSLGRSANGRFELLLSQDTPVDMVGVKQPAQGAGAVLHAQVTGAATSVTADAAKGALLRFEPSATAPSAQAAEVSLAVGTLLSRGVDLKLQLPAEVSAPAGPLELSYAYSVGPYRLAFARRGYKLSPGQRMSVRLGGPYECSVFHQFHKEFARKPNVLMYYLFVKDDNEHYLSDCSQMMDKRRREHVLIPLAVRLKGQTVFNSSQTKPDRQFASEAGSIPAKEDLDALQYEVALPFEGERRRTLKGHGDDLVKESAHYRFSAPSELAANVNYWLEGAETVYEGFCRLLRHTPRWLQKPGRCNIRFQIKMLPGVGAFAGGNNVTFHVPTGMALTHPSRILDIPFCHELLHTFGHGHQDYMHITCQEVCGQFADLKGVVRFKRGRDEQENLLRCMRGEPVQQPDSLVSHLLLARFGHEIFEGYLTRGRPMRERLKEKGLSEAETDCTVFAWLTRGQTTSVYEAADVPMDAAKLKAGLAALTGNAGEDGAASKATDAAEARAANKALKDVETAFAAKKPTEALAHVRELVGVMPKLGDHRFRAWLCCGAGELLFTNGKNEEAYQMLRESQRAAAKVRGRYFSKVRGICVNVWLIPDYSG